MPEVSFTGEFGGLLAGAFGAGCAAGYGFYASVIAAKFQKLFDDRIVLMTQLFDDRVKLTAAENLALRVTLDQAQKHFEECEDRLGELAVKVARLEEREATRRPPGST